ncbi:hypothetical protein BZA77DRAFT_316597 [Pyronema omphalodes]|nr:hypothetical protein BZA77DRAFT_316597 [Pyronema omphalodes]
MLCIYICDSEFLLMHKEVYSNSRGWNEMKRNKKCNRKDGTKQMEQLTAVTAYPRATPSRESSSTQLHHQNPTHPENSSATSPKPPSPLPSQSPKPPSIHHPSLPKAKKHNASIPIIHHIPPSPPSLSQPKASTPNLKSQAIPVSTSPQYPIAPVPHPPPYSPIYHPTTKFPSAAPTALNKSSKP